MREKIKEELDRLIAGKYECDLDVIRELYPLIRKSRVKAEGMRYFLERMDVTGTSVCEEDKEAVRTLTFYYDRYQALIHGVIGRLADENPDEKTFYEQLWSVIEEGPLVRDDDEDRMYAWLFVWRERQTPYFQMGEGITMSNEEYRALTERLFTATAKADYILRFPFAQRTQRCSQLVDLLEECETQEEKCVLMDGILRMKEQMKDPLLDKMMEVKRILDKEQ